MMPRPARIALLAAGVGAAQAWHGWRGGASEQHVGALLLGWTFAIAIGRPRRGGTPVRGWEQVLGAGVLAVAVAPLLVRGGYAAVDRVLPLAAGVGLAVLASGMSGLRAHARSLLLLAIPMVHPIPRVVGDLVQPLRELIEPAEATAAAAALMARALGTPVVRLGAELHVPGLVVEVSGACSGVSAVSELLVLAVVVLCVFRSTPLQKVGVLASSVAVGLLTNAARVGWITVVAASSPSTFEDWHNGTRGVLVSSAVRVALAGAAWWALLRDGVPAASASALRGEPVSCGRPRDVA